MVEERKINPETVKKDKEKKEWAIFVEDYNTGWLPSLALSFFFHGCKKMTG